MLPHDFTFVRFAHSDMERCPKTLGVWVSIATSSEKKNSCSLKQISGQAKIWNAWFLARAILIPKRQFLAGTVLTNAWKFLVFIQTLPNRKVVSRLVVWCIILWRGITRLKIWLTLSSAHTNEAVGEWNYFNWERTCCSCTMCFQIAPDWLQPRGEILRTMKKPKLVVEAEDKLAERIVRPVEKDNWRRGEEGAGWPGIGSCLKKHKGNNSRC